MMMLLLQHIHLHQLLNACSEDGTLFTETMADYNADSENLAPWTAYIAGMMPTVIIRMVIV